MTMANSSLRAAFNSHAPVEGIGSAINANKNLMKCVYDFAVLGGATGNLGLVDDEGNKAILPLGAIVTRSFVSVITAPASTGSATVAAFVVSAADVLAATAISAIAGNVEGKQTGAASLFTAAITAVLGNQASIAIATAPLSGGKMDIFLEYIIQ
jgi:hypothetical protein